MPHLRLEYSAGLEARVDLNTVCNKLSDTLKETGIFPLGGIRVRAFRAGNFSIADKHEMNTFCDMIFRIGQGRSKQDRIDVGEALMEEAKRYDEHRKAHYEWGGGSVIARLAFKRYQQGRPDVDIEEETTDATGLMSNGWTIYASQENLYVAQTSRWWWWGR